MTDEDGTIWINFVNNFASLIHLHAHPMIIAEAALARVRTPTNLAGEAMTRKRERGETPAQSELLDRLFVPVERLRQHNEGLAD